MNLKTAEGHRVLGAKGRGHRALVFVTMSQVFHPSGECQREDFKHGIPLSLNSLPVSVQLCVRFVLLNS